MLDAVVEGLQQEWVLALLNDILGKATYIQIVCYQVLDGRYLARDEPVFDLAIVFMAGARFFFFLRPEVIVLSFWGKDTPIGGFFLAPPSHSGWAVRTAGRFFYGLVEAGG